MDDIAILVAQLALDDDDGGDGVMPPAPLSDGAPSLSISAAGGGGAERCRGVVPSPSPDPAPCSRSPLYDVPSVAGLDVDVWAPFGPALAESSRGEAFCAFFADADGAAGAAAAAKGTPVAKPGAPSRGRGGGGGDGSIESRCDRPTDARGRGRTAGRPDTAAPTAPLPLSRSCGGGVGVGGGGGGGGGAERRSPKTVTACLGGSGGGRAALGTPALATPPGGVPSVTVGRAAPRPPHCTADLPLSSPPPPPPQVAVALSSPPEFAACGGAVFPLTTRLPPTAADDHAPAEYAPPAAAGPLPVLQHRGRPWANLPALCGSKAPPGFAYAVPLRIDTDAEDWSPSPAAANLLRAAPDATLAWRGGFAGKPYASARLLSLALGIAANTLVFCQAVRRDPKKGKGRYGPAAAEAAADCTDGRLWLFTPVPMTRQQQCKEREKELLGFDEEAATAAISVPACKGGVPQPTVRTPPGYSQMSAATAVKRLSTSVNVIQQGALWVGPPAPVVVGADVRAGELAAMVALGNRGAKQIAYMRSDWHGHGTILELV